MAWLSGWAKRRKITIDNTNIDSDLTHFPVPVVLGISVGQSAQDVSNIFDEVGSNSSKIAITKSDGTTQIYAEIELWDATAEDALLWVSKSDLTISAASVTELYIYYDSSHADNTTYIGTPGNRTEVWNSDFAAVYTMAQDPSGGADCIIDSTGNGNHGTPHGSMTSADLVDGQIGKAIDFDGSDDFIVVGDSTDLTFGSVFTILTTMKPHVVSGGTRKIIHKNSAWNIYINTSGSHKFTNYENLEQVSITEVATDTLYRIAFKVDNKSWAAYKNGVLSANGTFSYSVPDSNVDLYLGADEDESQMFYDGRLDHVFLLASAISEAWIKADDYAQTDNLITWGVEETQTTDPSVTTNSASDVTETSATLNGTLDDLGGESSVDVYFEYGTTTSYDSTTTAQTLSATGAFSDDLTGLTAEQTYHFRAAVTDGLSTWYGDDQTFIAVELTGGQFFTFPF